MRSKDLPADLRAYATQVTLRGGEKILVRAIHPDDKARLLEHFRGLSPASVHSRFFAMRRDLSDADLARLTELDFHDHVGLAATLGEAGSERFIGVGRYLRGANPGHAEVAFAVLDEHQGHGIATLLLEHLAHIARAQGIGEFDADVLADNRHMLTVFEQSGFSIHRATADGVVHLVFPIADSAAPDDPRHKRREPRE
ncbi:MAG TPA: GNAT family N-acetyltransferase [Candidatus Binataceae bacterium]|nr:GNAT family N-acetyltransferase [Candidatus Binataceae bacterium]